MKITVVIPVLNEAKSIDVLLNALAKQTLLPTEVIFVDGGSKDGTIEKIKYWEPSKTTQFGGFTLLERGGSNRSVARNIGIHQADDGVIVLTDAGCVPKSNWLELLVQPFKEDQQTQVVAGFYDPAPKNWFEDILADYTCVRKWKFDAKTFLPSSRSLAITKDIWRTVGGYPEELDTCEDLIFAEKLKAKAKQWRVVKEAQVVWVQPKSLSELNHKVFGYATGDLHANYQRHVKKIHSAMWRVIVLLGIAVPGFFIGQPIIRIFALSFFLLYAAGSLMKHTHMLKYPLTFIVLPIIQLTVDVSLVQALIFHKLSSQYK